MSSTPRKDISTYDESGCIPTTAQRFHQNFLSTHIQFPFEASEASPRHFQLRYNRRCKMIFRQHR